MAGPRRDVRPLAHTKIAAPRQGSIPANIYFNLKGELEDDRQRGGRSGNDEKENHRPPELTHLRHKSRVVLETRNLVGHINLFCKATC